ncbi:MetQ/NlpA family ABC transporter substrate-binding protein, partial [Zoogloea sp.]|uniref:MetQ/NlpA family ABC transporter substrate-binding protein n=1 Tax=Zoogloea sp. TaxID=49181 RepID=UPI00342CE006
RRHFVSETLRAVAVIGLATALGLGNAHADDKKTLTIGATAGSNFDQLKLGIKPVLEKKGYTVKLVEFNDYVQPNLALAQGSLDANLFQHVIYLKKFSADKGLNLVDVTKAPIAPLGLYSKKRKSLNDLKDGDRITLPNDPSNLARALVFLEQNKLIKVKAGVDPLKVTEKDVAENPRKLVLTPIEAAQLPRTLDDAEFALINGNFAISSGLKLTEAVALEKTPDHYLNVVAVKTDDKDKPWARDLVAAFRTPEYRAALDKHFAGYARPAYLQ